MQKVLLSSVALLVALSACASKGGQRGGPPGGGEGRGSASVNQPERLLSHARDEQAKKGCGPAIPAYRVAASFGDGYEVAQYELGACLLEVEATSDVEASLLVQEAQFWLNRAAWAGNARAQNKLATILSGANRTGAGLAPAPAEAIKWAFVYEQNSARKLYNMKPVSMPVMEHLRATLDQSDFDAAESFAAAFRPVSMPGFAGLRQERPQQSFQSRQQPPQGGQRRRR